MQRFFLSLVFLIAICSSALILSAPANAQLYPSPIFQGNAAGNTPTLGDGIISFDMSQQRVNVVKRLLTVPTDPGEAFNLQLYNNAPYALIDGGSIAPQLPTLNLADFGEWDQTIGGACPQNWFQSFPYYVGMKVNNNGTFYVATATGVSASSGGPTGTGTGIVDGSVVWNYVGAATYGTNCGTQSFAGFNSVMNLWGQRNYKNQDVAYASNVNIYGHDSAWASDENIIDSSGEPPQDYDGIGDEKDFTFNGPDLAAANYNPQYATRYGNYITFNTKTWPTWTASNSYVAPSLNQPGSVLQETPSGGALSIYKMVGSTNPCQSGGSAPTWPSTGTVTDGTCVWMYEQPALGQMSAAYFVQGAGDGSYWGTGFFTNASYSDAVIDISLASLNTSVNANAAGIRLAGNMPIDFDGGGSLATQNRRILGYTPGGGYLYFINGATTEMQIGDNGNDYFPAVMHFASTGSLSSVTTGYQTGLTVGQGHAGANESDLVANSTGVNFYSESGGTIGSSPILSIDGSGDLLQPGIARLGTGSAAALNGITTGYQTGLNVGFNHASAGETDFVVDSSGLNIYGQNSGTIASSILFALSSAGDETRTGHSISTQATAPTVAQTGGSGSSTLNSQATDSKGTVTEGTSATGFVVTFHTAYSTAPDCVVSSPTGSAFSSYTPATGSLTLVNSALTSAKFTYNCVQ